MCHGELFETQPSRFRRALNRVLGRETLVNEIVVEQVSHGPDPEQQAIAEGFRNRAQTDQTQKIYTLEVARLQETRRWEAFHGNS